MRSKYRKGRFFAHSAARFRTDAVAIAGLFPWSEFQHSSASTVAGKPDDEASTVNVRMLEPVQGWG
jgi:hypothetical protein